MIPGKTGMRNSQKEAGSAAERGAVPAQERARWAPSGSQGQRVRTAEPPHTEAATGCEAAAAARGPARALPAAHWRRIYRSRARGSRCLSEGGAPGSRRRHRPAVLGPWTRSIEPRAPRHSCSGSFKPSHPDHLFLFSGFLTTSVHPFTWKNELSQCELGQSCDSANRSLKVRQGTARDWCCHPEKNTFIS